ncbi:MAG: FAD-binding oxidoreductase [Bacteroidetes bacterium]|nr:FAD-binding oxidoreductase [Bacteroidota bacterium]
MKIKIDHIIVGQGLAGTCLALQLVKRQKKVIVFDTPDKNIASAVAAGLFNPVSGKWMTKAWLADDVFPYLFNFYTEQEQNLKARFFYPKSLYRPFISVEEQNEWMARSADRRLNDFIEAVYTNSKHGDLVYDPFGGIITRMSGFLNVNSFLTTTAQLLTEKDAYRNCFFDCSKLEILHDYIRYDTIEAQSVIFCDGFGALSKPFFNWLPIRALKGETLTISLDRNPEMIFNRGVYLVPQSNNYFIIGATYKPNDPSEGITTEGRIELEEKASSLLKIPFKVRHHSWGIRPTTHDRKPILGAHPKHKNIYIFNGLGTKGVSLAPYFSAMMADKLAGKSEILSEVNIDRFKALYFEIKR